MGGSNDGALKTRSLGKSSITQTIFGQRYPMSVSLADMRTNNLQFITACRTLDFLFTVGKGCIF
jgi:hypothetical protein